MKKLFTVLSVSILMLLALAFSSSAIAVIPGDFDNNGNVTAKDARHILRIAARLENTDDAIALVAADVNSDGKITVTDARVSLRIAARLETADNYETHDIEIEPGTPGDCEHEGVTDKAVCKDCGKVLVEHKKTQVGHKIVVEKGTPSTCNQEGWSDYEYCSVCKKVIKECKLLPTVDHKLGTDGVHCQWCRKVLYVYDDFKTFCSGKYKMAGTASIDGENVRITKYYAGYNTRTRTITSETDVTILCRNLNSEPRVYIASEPDKIYAELDYEYAYELGLDSFFYIVSAKLDPYAQTIDVSQETYHGRSCVVYTVGSGQFTSKMFFENGKLVGIKDYNYGECYSDLVISEFTGNVPNEVWYLTGYKCLDLETFFDRMD